MGESIMGSLNASLAVKMKQKFDPGLESELKNWLSEKLEQPDIKESSSPLQDLLKDGTILCRLMNTLIPGAIKRINTSSLPFKQMENISNYVTVCEKLGLSENERFQTLDLFEAKDIVCVMNHLRVLKLLSQRNPNLKLEEETKLSLSPKDNRSKRSSLLIPSTRRKWETPNSSKRSSGVMTTMDISSSVSSLQDDISTKEEFKYSRELEEGAKKWLRELFNDPNLFTKDSLANELHSGVLLCQVINKIQPGTITKISTSNFAYAQMENIGNYLNACLTLGLKKTDIFDTPDLYEKKKMRLVINNIHVLARYVEKLDGYTGPKIDDSSQIRTLFSSSLSHKDLDAILGKDEDRELGETEKEMVDWVNSQLSRRDSSNKINHISVKNIKTGVTLIKLLEIITRTDSIGYYEENPTMLWHCMQNASLVLRFIYEQTFVELECTAQEIVLGRIEPIVELLKFLREKFDVDYLFLKVLNEGEENKLSLKDIERSVTPRKSHKRNHSKVKDTKKLHKHHHSLKKAGSLQKLTAQSSFGGIKPSSRPRKASVLIGNRDSAVTTPVTPTEEKVEPKEIDKDIEVKPIKEQEEKIIVKESEVEKESTVQVEEEKEELPQKVDEQTSKDESEEESEESGSSETESSEESSEESSSYSSESSEYSSSSEDSTSESTEKEEEKEKENEKLKPKSKHKRIFSTDKAPRCNDETLERVTKAQNVVRLKVATELLQTEQNYIKNIEAVFTGLIQPLKKGEILNSNELYAVFCNLEEIMKAHKDFLSLLQKRIGKNWDDAATVGDIFTQKMDIFQIYRSYLVNYNISIVALQALKQKKAKFKQLVNKFQRIQMRTSRLNLESFLIMPVQRIPRYLLLMADIKKYTAANHNDYELLTEAIDRLQKILSSHNSGIDPKASGYAQKMLGIAHSIGNVSDIPTKFTEGALVISGRRLVKDGRLQLSVKGQPEEKYCFMFNDLLLLCDEAENDDSGQPFTYTQGTPLKSLKIVENSKSSLELINNESTLNLLFSSEDICKEWTKVIKEYSN